MINNMKTIKVRVTFTEEILGTSSANPEIHADFIASKAPDAKKMKEEIEAIGVEGVEEKQKTVFPTDAEGNPFLWDYQIKGFFKGACGFLRDNKTTEASKIKNYKKRLDGGLMIEPRQVMLRFPDGKVDLGSCQRPLRAQTMQGERVALANSETAPAGTEIEFDIVLLLPELEDFVYEALDYGQYSGMGQWRNSGKGRFVWDEREREGKAMA